MSRVLEFIKEGILNVGFPGSESGSEPKSESVSESEPERISDQNHN